MPDINLEIVEPGPSRTPITMRVHERGAGDHPGVRHRCVRRGVGGRRVGPGRRADGEITVHMDGGDARVRSTTPQPGSRSPLTGPVTVTSLDDRRIPRLMSNPYNEALGATLIERTKRERIVLVGVTLPSTPTTTPRPVSTSSPLLIDTAGADEAGRLVQRRDAPDHTWFIGKGKVDELRELCLDGRRRHRRVRQRADARRSSSTSRSCSVAPRSTAPR